MYWAGWAFADFCWAGLAFADFCFAGWGVVAGLRLDFFVVFADCLLDCVVDFVVHFPVVFVVVLLFHFIVFLLIRYKYWLLV